MSYSLDAYSVDVGKLRAVPGSKNKELLDAIPSFDWLFSQIDENTADLDTDEEKPPACAEAFEQIVNGHPYVETFGAGSVYGYALLAIVMELGERLEPDWTQIAGASDWFDQIDEALAALEIGLSILNLRCRGPLVSIPEPDDWPSLGWWTADEITAAARRFKEIDFANLDPTTAAVVGPVNDAVEDIGKWVALVRPGNWVVGAQS